MNADRRKRISHIMEQLNSLSNEIETLMDEEQEAYDNMPEGLQQGEAGDKAQNNVDIMMGAKDSVDDAISALGDVE